VVQVHPGPPFIFSTLLVTLASLCSREDSARTPLAHHTSQYCGKIARIKGHRKRKFRATSFAKKEATAAGSKLHNAESPQSRPHKDGGPRCIPRCSISDIVGVVLKSQAIQVLGCHSGGTFYIASGLPSTRELTTIKAFSVVIGAVRLGTKLRGLGSRLVSAITCFTSITQP